MTLPDLLILRHGETEWNRAGRWQGALDSPLTARGRAQARLLGRMLAGLGASSATHVVHVSPQGRAVTTARLALGDTVRLHLDPRLAEIGVGTFSGLSREEIQARSGLGPDAHFLDQYRAAPGGESFESLWTRAADFLTTLDRPAIIVTHGITSRFLRAAALGGGIGDVVGFPGGQGVIHRVREGRHETISPADLGLDEPEAAEQDAGGNPDFPDATPSDSDGPRSA